MSARAYVDGDRIVIHDPETGRSIWIRASHQVYQYDLIANFDYYYGAVRADDRRVVDYSKAKLHRVVGFDDFPVFFSSFAEPFDACAQYLELAQLQPGETVLDLGAYCGLTAIVFARAVGHGGVVVAVEPDPANTAACEMNLRTVAAMGWSNIRLLHCAVAGRDGPRELIADGNMGSGLAGTLHSSRGGDRKTVDALSLDSIVRITQLERVDFVKMDIESAELEVLRAAEAFLTKFRPRLVVEPHFLEMEPVADRVLECLRGFGYAAEIIPQRGYNLPLITARPQEGA